MDEMKRFFELPYKCEKCGKRTGSVINAALVDYITGKMEDIKLCKHCFEISK